MVQNLICATGEAQGTAVDPVCGMTGDISDAASKDLTAEHDGQTYYFCGKGCKLDFEDDPAAVLAPGYEPHM